jgi:hypothetical protein
MMVYEPKVLRLIAMAAPAYAAILWAGIRLIG